MQNNTQDVKYIEIYRNIYINKNLLYLLLLFSIFIYYYIINMSYKSIIFSQFKYNNMLIINFNQKLNGLYIVLFC